MEDVFPLSTQCFLLSNNMGNSGVITSRKAVTFSLIFCLLTCTQQFFLFILKPFMILKSAYQAYWLPGTTFHILPIENIISTLYILKTQDM